MYGCMYVYEYIHIVYCIMYRALRVLADTALGRVDIYSRKSVKIRVVPCLPKNGLVSSRFDSFGPLFLPICLNLSNRLGRERERENPEVLRS